MPKGGKKKVAPDVGCAGRGDEAWGERSGKKAKKKYAVDSPSPAATPPPDRCNGAPAVGACRQPACQPASQPCAFLLPLARHAAAELGLILSRVLFFRQPPRTCIHALPT